MRGVVDDVQCSIRQLRRRPIASLTAMAILALGIGAGTALWVLVDGVLLRPLPLPSPERIVTLSEVDSEHPDARSRVSPATFTGWRESGDVFDELAASVGASYVLLTDTGPVQLAGRAVTPGFFNVIGVTPTIGRPFRDDDVVDGAAATVAIISSRLWRGRLGGVADPVGRRLELDGADLEVIGVLPENFWFPGDVDVWTPLAFPAEMTAPTASGARYLQVFGRLRPGLDLTTASRRMEVVASDIADRSPITAGWTVSVVRLADDLVDRYRTGLEVLAVVGLLVVLLVAVNVAALLLATLAARRPELALRAALGATPSRLWRQLATEHVVLAATAGAAGTAIAAWVLHLVVARAPLDLPRLDRVTMDGRAFAWGAIATVVAVVAMTVPVMLSGIRMASLADRLNDARGTISHTAQRRVRDLIVILQVAMTVVLVGAAVLSVRSVLSLASVDTGLVSDGVASVALSLPNIRYGDDTARRQLVENALGRLADDGRVTTAGATTNLPFSGSNMTFGVWPADQPPTAEHQIFAEYHSATPCYFRTVGLNPQLGRVFSQLDGPLDEPVALVNHTLARLLWPHGEAIGRMISLAYGDGQPRRVVGVVGDITHFGLDSGDRPEVYVPFAQQPWPFVSIVARSSSSTTGAGNAAVAAVQSVDPLLALEPPVALDDLISRSTAPYRFQMVILGAVALLAVLLAMIAIHGTVAWSIRQREHEVGIRLALGANPRDIAHLVILHGARLTLVGSAFGLVIAMAGAPVMRGLIFGVGSLDPIALVAAVGTAALAGLVAIVQPVRRVVRLEPEVLLREQ